MRTRPRCSSNLGQVNIITIGILQALEPEAYGVSCRDIGQYRLCHTKIIFVLKLFLSSVENLFHSPCEDFISCTYLRRYIGKSYTNSITIISRTSILMNLDSLFANNIKVGQSCCGFRNVVRGLFDNLQCHIKGSLLLTKGNDELYMAFVASSKFACHLAKGNSKCACLIIPGEVVVHCLHFSFSPFLLLTISDNCAVEGHPEATIVGRVVGQLGGNEVLCLEVEDIGIVIHKPCIKS